VCSYELVSACMCVRACVCACVCALAVLRLSVQRLRIFFRFYPLRKKLN
jgi:hypothetical protein